MTALAPGENRPAPGDQLTITVASSASVDVSALLVNGAGRVRSDADFVFFNQPTGPGVVYRHGNGGPDVVGVQTSALPADVDKVVVTASLDGRGPTTFASVGALTATIESGSTALTFPISGLTTESGVVCVEIYRRNGAWKVRAIGQGYDDGLAGIASAFGVNLDDEPEVPAAQSAPVPPSQPPGYPSAPPPTYTQGNPVQQGQFAQPATPPPAYPGHGAPGQFVPPPAHQPQPSFSSQQGAQPVHSDLFDPSHAEVNGLGIQKQGGKMVKVGMNGEVMARSGSMVAYQGDLKFEALGSGGIGRAIRQHLTGEGVPLMKVSGRGDLFLANSAADVHIIDLDGTDGLTINGANVLAFDSTLRYDIGRVQGAAGYASTRACSTASSPGAAASPSPPTAAPSSSPSTRPPTPTPSRRGVVVQPANRHQAQRLLRPRPSDGPQHRRGEHPGLLRPRLRHRPTLRTASGRSHRRHRRRPAGRHRRQHLRLTPNTAKADTRPLAGIGLCLVC